MDTPVAGKALGRAPHLLPAAELHVWLGALGTLYGGFTGATDADVEAITAAVGAALDGRTLSREELAREVGRLTGSGAYAEWVRSSWGSALKAASLRGMLCCAPSEGNTVRFTSLARWLPDAPAPVPPTDGLREVARRFLHAYGPTATEDLGRWWTEDRSGRRVLEPFAPLPAWARRQLASEARRLAEYLGLSHEPGVAAATR